MSTVIIGAGPSGLYTAIKLKLAGVKDIVVIDPRAGEYVRPGHINHSVFKKAEKGLGVPLIFDEKKTTHIKDIERTLYSYAKSLGITFENASFLRFDNKSKAVVISKGNNVQTLTCDYVFDCTGSKRELVNKINEEAKDTTMKPFQLSPISSEVVVKNHLLAYVKMDAKNAKKADLIEFNDEFGLSGKTPLEFAKAMERLRGYGWRELGFPCCYNIHFEKDKVCFYTEAPDNLLAEQRAEWLQTVLECLTGDSAISFELLPPSKKYKSKPRLTSFQVDPKQLDHFFYKVGDDFCLIALGDAQIEPNYFLAHGLEGGFKRIDILMNFLTISNGEIVQFDGVGYEENMGKALEKHRSAIAEHYHERKKYFRRWLRDAKTYYELACSMQPELAVLQERLKEINILIAYQDAVDTLQNSLLEGNFTAAAFRETLRKVKEAFSTAKRELSSTYELEQLDAQSRLTNLPLYFKALGNQRYQKNEFDLALVAYKEALNLYEHEARDRQEIIKLYSNMILTYRKLHQGKEALELAEQVLITDLDSSLKFKKKIIFNTLKTFIASLSAMSGADGKKFTRKAAIFYLKHKEFIDKNLSPHLKAELKKIRDTLGGYNELRQEGISYFSKGESTMALKKYKDALLAHSLSSPSPDNPIAAELIANIVVLYRKLDRISKAFFIATPVLMNSQLATVSKKKILFNLIKGAVNKIQENYADAATLIKETKAVCDSHHAFIEKELATGLKDELAFIDSLTQKNMKLITQNLY
ncbi:hypothetical protein [Legionella cardiaca]|uniref:4-hydroxybenzoate 3-monooxygenase n=1 Tax=Legionella cardiaca TaxID=1071983 RepID=A0ABY8AXI1_9GAMM|nr:hypothetical protein [Legionella cardiaca]WED44454.1 hypothetical protein PXX05_06630 [Legionella cardiaca]